MTAEFIIQLLLVSGIHLKDLTGNIRNLLYLVLQGFAHNVLIVLPSFTRNVDI
jgi:hypothetical protein